MTAVNPFAAARRPSQEQHVDAVHAQAVAPEIPMRDRITALETALVAVHRSAVTVGERYRDARFQHLMWRDRVQRSDQPDASAPPEIAGPMQEANAAVSQLEAERADLLRQWTELDIGWEIPHHGLPEGNYLREIFEIQRPTPLPFEARLELLQRRFNVLTQDTVSLHEAHVRNPASVAHRRELTYLSILQAREELLREWDAGGMGTGAPPHGVSPEAADFFERFQQVDRDRLSALLARS